MRRLCACKVPHELSQEENKLLQHAGCSGTGPGQQVFELKGCPKCDNSGYRGRIGIHELMTVTDPMREKINAGTHAEVLKRLAREQGMRTLFEDSMEKVLQGVSTFAEALSTARPDEA
jgi:type IV pilus assembly protein PilB